MKAATIPMLALLFPLGVAAVGVARADAPAGNRLILVREMLETKDRLVDPSGSPVTVSLANTLPE